MGELATCVVHISAPAGSGKTVLMRSWIAEAGLVRHAAWVALDGQERDPRAFWISVTDALRGTAAGSALVRRLTAGPDLDGWAPVERLLTDLAPLEDRLWRRDHACCRRWCSWAKPDPPSRPWPTWTRTSGPARRCVTQ